MWDHSEIYKAMSQQLEKENKYLDAILKYTMHMISDFYHMFLLNKEWKNNHYDLNKIATSIEDRLSKKMKKFKMEKKSKNLYEFIKKYLEIKPKNILHASTIISDFEIKVQQILK